MDLPLDIHNRASVLLSRHPALGREADRRALLLAGGLDGSLIAQVDLGGAPFAFLAQLIDTLAEYGELTDGGDALTAFLKSCKKLFGVDGQQELDEIIALWTQTKQEQ